MGDYSDWNIQHLLDAQLKITIEIATRIKSLVDLENSFCTYNPNGSSDDYRATVETCIELVRKGTDCPPATAQGE